ncbi:hypothetical protein GIR22_01525 [Pseudomonas sp. CCM 7891]|uniref:Lipoprotein n=1 Tax=Pseudomonas karstica TaxID=1055468 RepID=A0A7X2RQ38_9PSED|nr:hypothetical protein [Pseudomonas karstica]MTD17827.1 hypothetical protein [Pseudomonas karstica]
MNQNAFSFLGVVFLTLALTACSQSKPADNAVIAQPSKASSGEGAEPGEAARQFVARGNEPFWTIRANGSALTWITPENSQGKQLKAERVVSSDKVKYTGKDADKAFTLLIVRSPCTDTMSGETFNFTSVWTHGKQSHTGCAASGN